MSKKMSETNKGDREPNERTESARRTKNELTNRSNQRKSKKKKNRQQHTNQIRWRIDL